MFKADTSRILLQDVQGALALLTRLPVPGRGELPPAGRAAWAWPLAGLVVALIAGVLAFLALGFGLPAGVAAAIAMAAQTMATGAMHEDGLADSADGLWGGWDRQRRLAIMKDSHIGSFGTLALLITGLARWSALSALFAAGWVVGPLVAAAVLSRAPMAAVQSLLPNARGVGLSQSTGRPTRATAGAATALALMLALLFLPVAALPMAIVAAIAAAICALIAHFKICGQTGDILGAVQQISELAALAAAAALLLP